MKQFVLKLLLFLSVFICLDFIGGKLLQHYRPVDYRTFLDSKLAFFSDRHQTDILIIGDSHVADALDPRTIESSTGYRAFNLGIYHSSPFENYYVTKAALDHLDRKPTILVLGTNPIMFERELSKGKYTPLILPKSQTIPLARNSAEGFDASFFFNFVREKYLFKSMISSWLGKDYVPTRIIEDVYNGHSKFYNQIPDSQWSHFTPSTDSVNPQQVDYFIKTIELAHDSNIEVIIVHPPIYKHHLAAIRDSESYKKFSAIIREIIKEHNLQSVHFKDPVTGSETSLTKEDFLNSQHLNYLGSLKFSQRFSDYIIKDQ